MHLEAKLLGRDKVAYTSAGAPARESKLSGQLSVRCALTKASRRFRWRCARGEHPFSSRTRRLRLKRPMVLHWRRCGRAGGCRIKMGLNGLEPSTSRLSGVRSNLLSYKPISIRQPPALPHRLQCSTIGRLSLNHRVRDENGCVP